MTINDQASARELFKEKCAEHNLKVTPQRVTIYEELLKAKDHPSADAIYKRVRSFLPNISFDTVYRTLLSFSEIGIINQVEGYGEKKRFEPNLYSHHHFRCLKCHAIIDFSHDAYNNIAVPDELKKQFQVLNKRVVLEGVCKECGKK
ncbi:MAG: transcriptional repressor [Candidatus Omnitrophica bacterium]|nr:transcriptional repressor [Candidatus Omnitrophota bacterium]